MEVGVIVGVGVRVKVGHGLGVKLGVGVDVWVGRGLQAPETVIRARTATMKVNLRLAVCRRELSDWLCGWC